MYSCTFRQRERLVFFFFWCDVHQSEPEVSLIMYLVFTTDRPSRFLLTLVLCKMRERPNKNL